MTESSVYPPGKLEKVLTVDLIVCKMEEMEAMGAPMAGLFREAEPRTLDVAASSVVISDT